MNGKFRECDSGMTGREAMSTGPECDGGVWSGRRVVLVVEDDDDVRRFVVTALQLHGHSVFAAPSPRHALDVYERHADSIGVILLDVVMPGMTGVELLTYFRRVRADTPVIFMTGCTPASLERVIQEPCVHGILSKPFRMEDMLMCVHRAMSLGSEPRA
ncbi:MAG: response regulator [Acidobacteria bacterium]|nr:response regulator [Acidobacteriota bacterium]